MPFAYYTLLRLYAPNFLWSVYGLSAIKLSRLLSKLISRFLKIQKRKHGFDLHTSRKDGNLPESHKVKHRFVFHENEKGRHGFDLLESEKIKHGLGLHENQKR